MFLQRLGGRKFLLAITCIGAGVAVDLTTSRGLSPALAGLMGAIVAAFSAANYAVSKAHFISKSEAQLPEEDVAEVSAQDMSELKELTAQIGEALIQTKQSVDTVKTLIVGAIKSGEKR